MMISPSFFSFSMPKKVLKKNEASTAESEGAFNNVAIQSNPNRESPMLPETEVNSDTFGISDLSIANSNPSENSKTAPPKESTDGIHEFIFGKSTWITTTIVRFIWFTRQLLQCSVLKFQPF